MKTYKKVYEKIFNISNLILAYKKARKGKSKKRYVKEFEKNLIKNLLKLQEELKNQTYKPRPLKTFILRDPKTRKISKSDFRDRIVHHAVCNVITPTFEKSFIYDSCANQKGKGNLFAIKRFDKFSRKISGNGRITKNNFNDNNYVYGYCLKADIKHYFQEVDHEILVNILKRRIKDKRTIWLIARILENNIVSPSSKRERERRRQLFINIKKGMPLGNLTSQFFSNVYLNELDKFVKHKLRIKYYIRYVDDFVILYGSRKQLKIWKKEIDKFLRQKLKLELHPDKSRIIPLSKGIDFVGFRNFYYFKLLRKRSINKMRNKIELFNEGFYSKDKIKESFQGWQAYAKWANTYKLRKIVESLI